MTHPSEMGPKQRVCFENCELDLEAQELKRDGVLQSLEPKAYDFLVYLIEHRTRLVTKRELLSVMWAETVVSQTAVSQCAFRARKAVGDDGAHQRIIRTVSRRGYRFVAEVRCASGVFEAVRPKEAL